MATTVRRFFSRRRARGWGGLLAGLALAGPAAGAPTWESWLQRPLLAPETTLRETQRYCDERVPRVPEARTAAEWTALAGGLRRAVLEDVVFRGEAARRWRDARAKVEWLETVPGGPGYRLRKLRYEALPGLWIPAILYEPEQISASTPVHLAVNGHEKVGKSIPYKQLRCINLAKRGIPSLNVEWLHMGQLRLPGFNHYAMNQLDLCGVSGLAPFYLAMSRALDLLLALPYADPERVAVSGLSGGGWQTIIISSLDPRVKLCNPVAGYSSFRTRLAFPSDLGDSEQTPSDLATVVDYTHLTAMLAGRAALLTYNERDNCCFAAGHALEPLLAAAAPKFRLYGDASRLQSHVNFDPGTHNFERDNREAFYRFLGEHFRPGDPAWNPREISSTDEVKTAEALSVELPAGNLDLNQLARAAMADLPRSPDGVAQNPAAARGRLRELLRVGELAGTAGAAGEGETVSGGQVRHWRLQVGERWTVPITEFSRGTADGTTILLLDGGRRTGAAEVERLLAQGRRVLAVDLFGFGEAKIAQLDFLYAMTLAAVGGRPLGVQVEQVAAVARWAQAEFRSAPVALSAVGRRTSLIAQVAAALERAASGGLETRDAIGSLKELIVKNVGVNEWPEAFCFGLLEACDVPQLQALAASWPPLSKR